MAVKLYGVAAGTYDMTFDLGPGATNGGLAKVYVVKSDAYTSAVAPYLGTLQAGTSLTKDENDAFIAALNTDGSVLNAGKEGVLDCYKCDALVKEQSIGEVTFPESGEYVLVFQCAGSSSNNTAGTAYQFQLLKLNMSSDDAVLGGGSEGGDEGGNEGGSEDDTEEEVVVNYRFGFESLTGTQKGTAANPEFEIDFNSEVKCSYLNISAPSRGFNAGDSSILARFNESDYFDGSWMAVKLYDVAAGTYDMTFDLGPGATNGGRAKVYVVKSETYERAVSQYLATLYNGTNLSRDQNNTFVKALYENEGVLNAGFEAVLDCYKSYALVQYQSIGNVKIPESGEYVLVFQCAGTSPNNKTSSTYQFQILKLAMTLTEAAPGGGVGDGGSGGMIGPDDSMAVDAEIVAKNAISSGTVIQYKTWKNPKNGHNYQYFMYKGGLLAVYDMDLRQVIDLETDCYGTVRDSYVDENGILWICGAARWLYKYDPYTGTATQIPMPDQFFPDITSFNAYAITGDGQGKLYFGTYNKGYLVVYDTKTDEFTKISGWLDATPETGKGPDAGWCGFGGLILQDGYIYTDIRGNLNGDTETIHQIIKYDIANQKIVDHISIAECLAAEDHYLSALKMVNGVLLGTSSGGRSAKNIAIDTTGEQMKLIEIEGLENGFYGNVSDEIDGQVYFWGYLSSDLEVNDRCLFAYDGATRKVTVIEEIPQYGYLTGDMICVEGDDRLPGQSIVCYKTISSIGRVDIVMYNPVTKQMVAHEDIMNGIGTSGSQLRALATDPDGKNVYVGAYGVNPVSKYNIADGAVIKQIPTHDHQTDGLFWYNGYLYAGNYNVGTITQVDTETGEVKPLFELFPTVFQQKRMHSLTAGDGKVFCGTVPENGRYGGVLVWYDLDKKLTYVAAGPNPEDVFYAKTYDWENDAMLESYVWHSALTGEVVDFDDNNDGVDDFYATVNGESRQRFLGLIENQTVCEITYQDGYIYGLTSKAGGSGTDMNKYEDSAVIFVYDVAAMKVIATYDLCDGISGLKTPVLMIDALAADPTVEGKFWGVVCDTLFSFTFDTATATFSNVKEALSYGKSRYNYGGNQWASRDIVFDGEYMYVVLGSIGTLMVNRANPEEHYAVSYAVPKAMAMAADGNLYFVNNDNDLKVIRLNDTTAPVKDPSEAAAVQKMIDALEDTANITLEDEAAVIAARKAYDNLTETGKAMVNAEKLLAAEAVIAPLRAAADKAAADAVIAQIQAIDTVTLESESAIKAARDAYNALTEAQKKLVDTAALTAAETKLAELKAQAEKEAADKAAADVVIAQISAIGTVTLNSKAAIEAARTAYEALTAEQKALVTNLNVLTTAEAALEALQKPAEPKPEEPPKTGEYAPIAVWTVILVASVVALSAVLVCDIRRKRI